MSEEIQQVVYDLAYWQRRAVQAEAMAHTLERQLEMAQVVVALARTAVRRGVFPRELREAIEDYDAMVRER